MQSCSSQSWFCRGPTAGMTLKRISSWRKLFITCHGPAIGVEEEMDKNTVFKWGKTQREWTNQLDKIPSVLVAWVIIQVLGHLSFTQLTQIWSQNTQYGFPGTTRSDPWMKRQEHQWVWLQPPAPNGIPLVLKEPFKVARHSTMIRSLSDTRWGHSGKGAL